MCTLAELLHAHADVLHLTSSPRPEALAIELDDVIIDSREARPGALFAALVGARADGHDYVARAIVGGASVLLLGRGRTTSTLIATGVAIIEADHPRAVLGQLSATVHGHPTRRCKVVGVTGTNGKTTSSFLLGAIFEAAGIPHGTIGTVGYRWPGHELPAPNTTPESALVQRLVRRMVDDGVEAVCMEVSSHALSTWRVEGVAFDVGVFTNLSQDHLDFHGSMEAYRDAKASLFTDHLNRAHGPDTPRGVACLNVDDAEGRRLAALLTEQGVPTRTFSCAEEGAEATLRVEALEMSLEGQRAQVLYHVEGEEEVRRGALFLPMPGRHNLSNALAMAQAALILGVPWDTIAEGLAHAPQVPGRLERVRLEADAEGGVDADALPAVFVDYAHTPDALERALETLRPHAPERLWVVFGCGGDRDRDKRPKMGRAAEQGADVVVLTSDNPRTEDPDAILDDILAGMAPSPQPVRLARRDEAIAHAIAEASPRDVILIAGKGHETYQEIQRTRRPFDDREHARAALRARQHPEHTPS